MSWLLRRIGIDLPIIQAPMAGVSTPEMAAAVSNASGLGSVGVGSVDAEHAVAKAAGEFGYGAQWAGQGAPLARAIPAAELVARLRGEMEQALADRLPG
jgi:NAD(P)H-dependent flavin oxidoreductase YrpB (nitropropane dioxygenase family)